MKRILMMIFRNIFVVPAAWIKLCWYAAHTEKYEEEVKYKHLKYIVHRANKGGNIEIDVHGQEKLPKESGYILYPNHQGLYDVLAMVHACPIPIACVAKKEVANVPFIKQVMACTKSFVLDRDDVKQGLKVILNVAEEVKKGRNYLIFAEGTRSKQGNKTQEFKGGSFKAATKAKCPIIPVALIDSYKAFDTGSTETVKVQVHFLEPILYDEYKNMKTVEIAEEVRRRIEKEIERNI